MKKLTIIIVTVLLITFCGCSGGSDNKPNFDVVSSDVVLVKNDTGEYSFLLACEVSNLTNGSLYFKESDFDIVDENDNLIDTMQLVSAYPPIVDSKKTAVYYDTKISDKILDANMELKAIPHIETEKSKVKLTTLPTPGGGMDGVFVKNPANSRKEYENVQVAVICKNPNSNVTGVLTAKINSIKPGEEVEVRPEGRLIEKNLDPRGGSRCSFFAYLEPYTMGKTLAGQTMRDVIIVVLSLLILGCVVWLQIFLSKKRNKWLGLILPSINLVFSLTAISPLFQGIVLPQYYEKFDEYGVLIETATIEPSGGIFYAILTGLLIYNISTLVFMVIYWICRNKRKRQQETHFR
ncbi:MAG: hypothetical protein BWY15_01576 [Firmicutes bacterium ADurb.Bin193]|nr:MAG: hypothetical protein BWY15_01576 [Firmicutes bacterium ADurb.Bin193]